MSKPSSMIVSGAVSGMRKRSTLALTPQLKSRGPLPGDLGPQGCKRADVRGM
jgi:hypothetical protein